MMEVNLFNTVQVGNIIKDWYAVTELGDVEMLAVCLDHVAAYMMGDDGDAVLLWKVSTEKDLLTKVSTRDLKIILELIVTYCIERKHHTLFELSEYNLVIFRLQFIIGTTTMADNREVAKCLLEIFYYGPTTLLVVDDGRGEGYPAIKLKPEMSKRVIDMMLEELFAEYF